MKRVFLVISILVLGGLVVYRLNARMKIDEMVKNRQQQVVLPSVTAVPVESRVLQPKILITGDVRAQNDVEIVSKAAGRVTKVHVDLGSTVKRGQVLLEVESNVSALQLRQAQGVLEATNANLEIARKSFESAETLAKSSNIADISLVQARSALQAAKAQVTQAEAAVGLAREGLANTRVTSPIDGVVTRKNVNVGVMVNPGGGPMGGLLQIQDISRLKLQATVDEKEVPLVHVGQTVAFEVDPYPGRKFNGSVTHLAPSLDPISRRAEIQIAVDNPEGVLFANMFARAEIHPEAGRETLVIPTSALVKGQEGTAVFILKGDTVALRPVRIGISDGQFVAVHDGLTVDEQVVSSGQTRLIDGSKVLVQAQVEAK